MARKKYRDQPHVKQKRMYAARRWRLRQKELLARESIGRQAIGHQTPHETQTTVVEVVDAPISDFIPKQHVDAERSSLDEMVPGMGKPTEVIASTQTEIRCIVCSKVLHPWIVQDRWTPRLRRRWRQRKEKHP
jgi:hypothetical protein